MQSLQKIAMFYAQYNIKMQAYQISTKQNLLADMLSRGLYTKIGNKYPFLQIAQSKSEIP